MPDARLTALAVALALVAAMARRAPQNANHSDMRPRWHTRPTR